jgi:hypothetical protein
MGMDLRGAGGYFGCNSRGWGDILRLAHLHGWIPVGTLAPLMNEGGPWDGPWGGRYCHTEGQRVTDDDALALADALERALPDLPDENLLADKEWVYRLPGGTELRGIAAGVETSLIERLSGDAKPRLREFIAFCRAGGFTIR